MLEGGYNRRTLAEGVAACINALMRTTFHSCDTLIAYNALSPVEKAAKPLEEEDIDDSEESMIRISPSTKRRVEEQVSQLISLVKATQFPFWSCFSSEHTPS